MTFHCIFIVAVQQKEMLDCSELQYSTVPIRKSKIFGLVNFSEFKILLHIPFI